MTMGRQVTELMRAGSCGGLGTGLGFLLLPMVLPHLAPPHAPNIIKNALGFFLVGWFFKNQRKWSDWPPYLSLYRLLHGLFAVDVDLLVA